MQRVKKMFDVKDRNSRHLLLASASARTLNASGLTAASVVETERGLNDCGGCKC